MVQCRPRARALKQTYDIHGRIVSDGTAFMKDGTLFREVTHWWVMRNWSDEKNSITLCNILNQKKFFYEPTATHDRLVYLAGRADRGLISYDACDLSELQKFARDRKLQLQDVDQDDKDALIEILEDADENGTTFDGISNLPPELRTIVNTYYFNSIKRNNFVCAAPPLATVSRQLRQETLPQFYGDRHFEVDFTQQYGQMQLIYREESNFFKHAPKGHIALIKRLAVGVVHDDGTVCSRWEIDLPTSFKSATCSRVGKEDYDEDFLAQLEADAEKQEEEADSDDEYELSEQQLQYQRYMRLEASAKRIERYLREGLEVLELRMNEDSFESNKTPIAGVLVDWLRKGRY